MAVAPGQDNILQLKSCTQHKGQCGGRSGGLKAGDTKIWCVSVGVARFGKQKHVTFN